jgi:DUF1365 family protein
MPLWSARGPAPAWFRRADHLGDPTQALADAVRSLVAHRTGRRPDGPIRLLTNLRYLGHCFNPVSFYYCFDAAGRNVEAVVAEVTNTPWGERHAYVLGSDPDRDPGGVVRGRFEKAFHVSPFMGMDYTYDWRLTEPGPQLLVHIDSEQDGAVVFDATLSLERRPFSASVLVRHPAMTLRVVGHIYAHALRLKLKGARYHPNPSGAPFAGRAKRDVARRSRETAAHGGGCPSGRTAPRGAGGVGAGGVAGGEHGAALRRGDGERGAGGAREAGPSSAGAPASPPAPVAARATAGAPR